MKVSLVYVSPFHNYKLYRKNTLLLSIYVSGSLYGLFHVITCKILIFALKKKECGMILIDRSFSNVFYLLILLNAYEEEIHNSILQMMKLSWENINELTGE